MAMAITIAITIAMAITKSNFRLEKEYDAYLFLKDFDSALTDNFS